MQVNLGTIQETALIPLWARATEFKKSRPIVRDEKSVEICRSLDYDFSKFKHVRASQIGCCIRCAEFDGYVRQFATEHPSGSVVDMGAGLNSRFERVDNGKLSWFEIDFPDVIELRAHFFASTARRHPIAGSALTSDWVAEVRSKGEGPFFFLFEGVLMYFMPSEVTRMIQLVEQEFPGSTIAFDSLSTWVMRHQYWHDCLKYTDARFRWGIEHPFDLQQLSGTLHVDQQTPLYDIVKKYRRQMPMFSRLSSRLATSVSRRVAESFWFFVVRLNPDSSSSTDHRHDSAEP